MQVKLVRAHYTTVQEQDERTRGGNLRAGGNNHLIQCLDELMKLLIRPFGLRLGMSFASLVPLYFLCVIHERVVG